MTRCVPVLLVLLLVALPARAEPLVLAWPTPSDIGDWDVKEFEGETHYHVLEVDGQRVLEAHSVSTASSLFLEREIDLTATPILEWSWRIEKPMAVKNEQIKEGRRLRRPGSMWSHPERDGSGMPRAINYVWTNRTRIGDAWPNPFASEVMMVAVESGHGNAGTWRTYRRDVRADFRRLFGMDVNELEGIAVMTDSDNSRQSARAWYGEISLHPE